MVITLDTKKGTCTVHREPNDPHMRKGGWGLTAESMLLHHVKRELQALGYDVIKKRMWRDGHMVDETQQYVRQRRAVDGVMLAIYSTRYAVEDAGEVFNQRGEYVFALVNLHTNA